MNSWDVDVGGVERRVVAETDPESGRTQIRIDGRMAARPMAAHENERRFTIGSTGYVLRRDDAGELDLDLDPDAPLPAVAPPAYKQQEPVEKPRSTAKAKILSAIVTVVVLVAVRWGMDVVRYMRVPWKVYDPADHQFRVSFPTAPEESVDSISAGGEVMRTVKLQSRYHKHFYVLEWIEFPFLIPNDKEAELITGALDGMVRNEQASLVQNGWSHIARRDSMQFIMQMPKNKDWSGGTARGHIVRSGQRLYILYAYVPRRESLAFDVGEYLRSLDLPD
ncbi:MAG: hypothetical protein ACJ74H_21080 [Thermoanaerobaculia bacterium]